MLSRLLLSTSCAVREPEPERLLACIKAYENQPEPDYKFSFVRTSEAVDILTKMHLDAHSVLCAILRAIPFPIIKEKCIDTQILSAESADIIKHLDMFRLPIQMEDTDRTISEVIVQLIHLGSIDPRILFIKIAFMVARLREAHKTQSPELIDVAGETLRIYAPLVHRLGFYDLKSELENTAFKTLYPNEYRTIQVYTEQKADYRARKIVKTIARIDQILNEHAIKGDVSGRMKAFYSIYKKTLKKNVPLSEVYDFVAFRIILESEEHCYELLSRISNAFKPLDRFKDYINNPKPNGYQSLHTTVEDPDGGVFEIQIRSRQMHVNSEHGMASHWSYKENKRPRQTDDLGWIRNLNETLKKSDNPQNVFTLFEAAMSAEFIYVFTPNGQLVKLPKNATVIDFAFAIHSAVGLKCSSARIDGKFATIRTALHNGEQVEIITAKNVSPSASWLDFAATKKSKQHIKQSLVQLDQNELRGRGVKILMKLFKKTGIKFSRLDDLPAIKQLLKKRKKSSPEELYRNIATVGISEEELNELIRRPEKPEPSTSGEPLPPTMSVSDEKFLNIKGQLYIPVRFAKCCRPKFPQSIFGIAAAGNMVIHQNNCPTAGGQDENENKKIPLSWDTPQPSRNMNIEITYATGLKTTAKIYGLLANFGDAFVSGTVVKRSNGELKQTLALKVTDEKKYRAFHAKLIKIKGLGLTFSEKN